MVTINPQNDTKIVSSNLIIESDLSNWGSAANSLKGSHFGEGKTRSTKLI